ncbi:LCP family protein [Peribacillus sp. SCS-155]|uniref:LCP family protein n=1 Tax=Peribacillus sedimenti TaxID=3115297 RepID=UPI0039059384
MEQTNKTRTVKRVKKKGRKRKVILSIFSFFLLLIFGFAAYFFVQYKQSFNSSKASSNLSGKQIEFNGTTDKLDKVNILLLGIDARNKEVSRTDTIIVAQYDPKTKTSKMVSIMRDIYVDIPGYKKNKINSAYSVGGAELLRRTLKENFDLDIEYYALIDFKGFVNMIDEAFPEGIEMDVEKRMSKNIGVTLNPGIQKLHGKELLGYVRYRADGSDFNRVERQQKAIKVLVNEAVSLKGVMKIPNMIGAIQPHILTNMETTKMLAISTSFLSAEGREIQTMSIPVKDSFTDPTYEGVGRVLDIDLEKNKQELHNFLEGSTAVTVQQN